MEHHLTSPTPRFLLLSSQILLRSRWFQTSSSWPDSPTTWLSSRTDRAPRPLPRPRPRPPTQFTLHIFYFLAGKFGLLHGFLPMMETYGTHSASCMTAADSSSSFPSSPPPPPPYPPRPTRCCRSRTHKASEKNKSGSFANRNGSVTCSCFDCQPLQSSFLYFFFF